MLSTLQKSNMLQSAVSAIHAFQHYRLSPVLSQNFRRCKGSQEDNSEPEDGEDISSHPPVRKKGPIKSPDVYLT